MFGLIAISRPKKSFKISNRCIIKNKTAMKLLLLATIKLFLLSILNVFYLYLKISMVVKSIFLFWIFPIRHLPTIITSLTLWPGGGGGLPGSWAHLGPAWSPPHRDCHQENKSQQHYPSWQIHTAPAAIITRPSSVLKLKFNKNEFIIAQHHNSKNLTETDVIGPEA